MFVYVDRENRITAYTDEDMETYSNWYPAPETISNWHPVPEAISEPLFVQNCAAVYKYEDGHAVLRTQEEIDADLPHSQPEPEELSDVERLRQIIREQQAQLDEQADALIELAGLIGG